MQNFYRPVSVALHPMKSIVAIIVFFALLAQTFQMVVIEANFFINRDFIANNLCENKARPQMHCNGHCQLKKELEKQEKKSAPQKLQEVNPFLISYVQIFPLQPVAPLTKNFIPYQPLHGVNYADAIMHPPSEVRI